MKKYLLFALAFVVIVSCSEAPVKNVPIINWVDGIVAQYPNLHTNDINMSVVKDSVSAYSRKYIGKEASLFEGVAFRFEKMVENGDSLAVFFDAKNCYSDIDHEAGNNKHIFTDINMRVLGKVDKQTAATLDKSKSYFISGKVEEWDEEDRFYITNHNLDYLDFGTFILNDNIKIVEIVEK